MNFFNILWNSLNLGKKFFIMSYSMLDEKISPQGECLWASRPWPKNSPLGWDFLIPYGILLMDSINLTPEMKINTLSHENHGSSFTRNFIYLSFKDNTVSTAVMQTSQLKNLHSVPHQNQRCLLIFSLLITQFKSINMYIYILENDT